MPMIGSAKNFAQPPAKKVFIFFAWGLPSGALFPNGLKGCKAEIALQLIDRRQTDGQQHRRKRQ